jgi:opacity protein-like surface antigen
MSIQRWILLALIAAAIFAVMVSASDADADDEPVAAGESVDAEDADADVEDLDADAEAGENAHVKAGHYFPKYANLKVPAGERVEVLVPISNLAGSPTYEVALIAGHIATLDHQRFIQNFSAQVYNRKLQAGETATIKYSVTPDALLEPSEYAFVIAAYLRTDDNTTIMVSAYNNTMLVVDPLGFDFKGTFTMFAFFGGIAFAVWYFIVQPKQAAAASTSAAAKRADPVATETGTKNTKSYDPDFVDPSHLAFLKAKAERGRSASPKNQKK